MNRNLRYDIFFFLPTSSLLQRNVVQVDIHVNGLHVSDTTKEVGDQDFVNGSEEQVSVVVHRGDTLRFRTDLQLEKSSNTGV